MTDVVDKISILQKFLNILTWKKLVQLIVFFLIVGTSWGLFENRTAIYGLLRNSRFADEPSNNHELSKSSVSLLDNVVVKSDLIVGLQITIVNFHRNTRLVVYSSIDDDVLKKIYNVYIEKSIGEVPLFNADAGNNVRMSQLINGEFVCNPYKDTIAFKILPEASSSVAAVCANGIPPYYGKFTGIVTLYLKRMPTDTEKDQLKVLSKELSMAIFEKDFK